MLESVSDNRLEKEWPNIDTCKGVDGDAANTFLARVSELRIGIYIRACIAKSTSSQNEKWEIHSPVICQKNKKKI